MEIRLKLRKVGRQLYDCHTFPSNKGFETKDWRQYVIEWMLKTLIS